MRTQSRKDNLDGVVIDGSLWFCKEDSPFVGMDRIRLLEKIDELGSINKAAKVLGISYRTAWDAVNLINNLAEDPVVEKLSGGKGGGGTHLTESGRDIVRKYILFQEAHQDFLADLKEQLGDLSGLHNFLDRVTMRVSARNVFYGTISKIIHGTVHVEVRIALKEGASIKAIITESAADSLALREGKPVYALVQAGSVVVADAISNFKVSAGNFFDGTVSRLLHGPVNSEVDIELPGGETVSAVITLESAHQMALQPGCRACVFFKASHVILGVR
ncbi:TOBE domain-containing protein [uncultured Desulfuromonas sp.]|uniref:TOBE domain-containing protein n=1 Tax=uncultured Desulfuromonas sp. TaxID=181013 RepID=UPI002AABF122|nr:TOBE domain-containing protein [uncultured Desulfuromonas sp.]